QRGTRARVMDEKPVEPVFTTHIKQQRLSRSESRLNLTQRRHRPAKQTHPRHLCLLTNRTLVRRAHTRELDIECAQLLGTRTILVSLSNLTLDFICAKQSFLTARDKCESSSGIVNPAESFRETSSRKRCCCLERGSRIAKRKLGGNSVRERSCSICEITRS